MERALRGAVVLLLVLAGVPAMEHEDLGSAWTPGTGPTVGTFQTMEQPQRGETTAARLLSDTCCPPCCCAPGEIRLDLQPYPIEDQGQGKNRATTEDKDGWDFYLLIIFLTVGVAFVILCWAFPACRNWLITHNVPQRLEDHRHPSNDSLGDHPSQPYGAHMSTAPESSAAMVSGGIAISGRAPENATVVKNGMITQSQGTSEESSPLGSFFVGTLESPTLTITPESSNGWGHISSDTPEDNDGHSPTSEGIFEIEDLA
ncbi:uncharacterized protein LOC133371450 [Rhineura floridana]|uniref:uncharacterized protein LOC133371450 n=1 Tax=Rhineura floridana TaxID=261503 RepID=UPI002AC84F37|nr:uncharacterized protein LOC133371450 [Rhineura floridana]